MNPPETDHGRQAARQPHGPAGPPFKPPHVRPAYRPLSLPEVALAAQRNVLETIPALAYERAIVSGVTVRPWHMIMEPSALRQVLVDKVDAYPKSDATIRLLKPAVGLSIFTAVGDDWRWQRRAAAPIFAPRRLTDLAPMMSAAASAACDRIDRAIAAGFRGRGVVCVQEEMVGATFDVVCDALLAGGRIDPTIAATPQAEGPSGAAIALNRQAVGEGVTRYLNTVGRISILDIIGAPNWAPRPAEILNRDVMGDTIATVQAMVAARRRQLEVERAAPRADLIDYLLTAADGETGRRMDDATLCNNLLAFIVAGHETTALALAWALFLLANDTEAQERAAAEARAACGDGPAEAQRLPDLAYVGQVIDETMRLFPPAAMLGRKALRADTLLGRAVAPGDMIIIPIYALHRHSALWENPMGFDPDRFAPQRAAQRDRFAYLPFGAGPRICIGAGFALMEAKLILATLLARYRVTPKPKAPPPKPVLTMTLRPEKPLALRFERR